MAATVDILRLENKEGGNVMGGGANTSSESKTQEGEGAEGTCLEAKKRQTDDGAASSLSDMVESLFKRFCLQQFENTIRGFFSVRLLEVRVV